MTGYGLLMIIVIFVTFAILVVIWQFSAARKTLEQWANANNYEILSSEHRWLRMGPFWWSTSKSQQVYYVTIKTPDGQIRSGWVRCGSWFFGMLVDQADVRWDE